MNLDSQYITFNYFFNSHKTRAVVNMLNSRWFRLGISRKDFFTTLLLLFNAFTWYYATLSIIDNALKASKATGAETLMVWAIYYTAVVASSLAGSMITRFRRLDFLYFWMVLGVISSLLPLHPFVTIHVWVFLLGASFGLGIPSTMAYFADCSSVENRGRFGGIISIVTFLGSPLMVAGFSVFDLSTSFLLLATWRGAGLLSLAILKPKQSTVSSKKTEDAFPAVLQNKSFTFYLVPWVMFVLIDRFTRPIFLNFVSLPSLSFLAVLEPLIGSFSAFFGGLLSDRIGRKRVVMYGFVALGLAYASIGIASTNLIAWYFYAVVDGVAWGILMVTFILTIWGDLSPPGIREKYYVVGNIPLFVSSIIQLYSASNLMQIPANAAFSLASFFLFIAVLPLLYAPETLPEKKIELRRLKGYSEQAKKVRDKYLKKSSVKKD